MTRQNRRRTFIATVAAAMLLAVAFCLSRGDSSAFFEYLARHPSIVPPVRMAFKLAGKESTFNAKLWMAIVARTDDDRPPIAIRDAPPLSDLR
jgi:hypothetical protein